MEFDALVSLVAHKLVVGQRIAIHNDYLFGKESPPPHHSVEPRPCGPRWRVLLMLFNSFDSEDIHRVVRPVTGSAIGFEIGENSHSCGFSAPRRRTLHSRLLLCRSGLCVAESDKQIKKAFRHSAEPWFPGLADRLTEIGWQRLAGREFFPANYGTHRWLRNDPSAERWVVAELAHGGRREYQVEVLPASSRGRYEQLGLVFGSFISAGRDISAVDSALSLHNLGAQSLCHGNGLPAHSAHTSGTKHGP